MSDLIKELSSRDYVIKNFPQGDFLAKGSSPEVYASDNPKVRGEIIIQLVDSYLLPSPEVFIKLKIGRQKSKITDRITNTLEQFSTVLKGNKFMEYFHNIYLEIDKERYLCRPVFHIIPSNRPTYKVIIDIDESKVFPSPLYRGRLINWEC